MSLVWPLFQILAAGLLPQMLNCLMAVILVCCLVRTNKFLMKHVLMVEKDHQHALDCWHNFLCFVLMQRVWISPLTELMFGFCIVTVNTGFIFFYDPQDEVLVDFIQQFLAHRHTLLLLLIVEHLRHKLHGDTPFVQVLYWNSLACSIQEA